MSSIEAVWEKIKTKPQMRRRTGCSTTAEGDMLAAPGYCCGILEATDFSVEEHKQLALAYYNASVDMGERGVFEIYDAEREKNNSYILRVCSSNALCHPPRTA